MSLAEVYKQIGNIRSIQSTLDKQVLLGNYLRNYPLFRKTIIYALDSRKVYNVHKFPRYGKYTDGVYCADEIFKFLKYLTKKPGASNEDKATLYKLMSTDRQTYEVVKLICRKKLQCGVSVKTVNKAVPGTVFYIPYCRCSSDKKLKNIQYPALIQEKADGTFANVFVYKDYKVEIKTREGKKIKQLNKLQKRISKICKKHNISNVVLHGELLIVVNGLPLDRQTGNGIITSCIYGTAEQYMADKAIIQLWDIIPIPDFWNCLHTLRYADRYKKLLNINSRHVCIIPTQEVVNEEQAIEFFEQQLKQNKEGAVLKDKTAIWKDHTSPKQIKLKDTIDVDLRIIDWYPGREGTKYEHCVGGLKLQSDCGKLHVNVGSGLTDKQRGYVITKKGKPSKRAAKEAIKYWSNAIGKIVHLECNALSYNKVDDKYSLFLPRNIVIREDKNTTDKPEELLKR